MPLSPQLDVYAQREKEGSLLIMCIYDDAKSLLGYFLGFIAPGLHYSTCLTCTMDILYIRPKFRHNPLIARRLLRSVERELKSRRVQRWFVGSKLHKDIGRLFTSLKFEPVETYYSKWLGE